MNDDEHLKRLLQGALPPVTSQELARDLWPQTLRRLERAPAGMTWVDWALGAAAALWVALFPSVIPGLLYHF